MIKVFEVEAKSDQSWWVQDVERRSAEIGPFFNYEVANLAARTIEALMKLDGAVDER
jgi:hypothetical protein